MNKFFIYCFLPVCFFMACTENKAQSEQGDPFLGYRLQEPEQVFELPEELEEVSGLHVVSEDLLLMNEDETASLYLYSLAEAALMQRVEWGEEGDYEGVALQGNTAFVVESGGDIYEIRNFRQEEPEVIKHENDGLKGCDVEGLELLAGENKLLLACKEGGDDERSVYAFDLSSKKLMEEPYRTFSFKALEEQLLQKPFDRFSKDLREMFDGGSSSDILFPSGIAVHPLTQDLYVLSAETKLLAVFDTAGKLKDVYELTHDQFLQPESIAFMPNGDLFIGNEGKGGEANILKFVYAQK
ncbi:hypothetical protein [Nafulsella turpanensis]|uniref:hypothetical protein n=1 Tax=Nafulsella turpanensis TaxID=1265690 RepID=UPI0012690B60|nr:hypothetical protein [Nafulsella turpanensis]